MKFAEIPRPKSVNPMKKIALMDELGASIPPTDLPSPASHPVELDRRLAKLKKSSRLALARVEARTNFRQKTKL